MKTLMPWRVVNGLERKIDCSFQKFEWVLGNIADVRHEWEKGYILKWNFCTFIQTGKRRQLAKTRAREPLHFN